MSAEAEEAEAASAPTVDDDDEDPHWSEAKYFWGPLCGAVALIVIFIIILVELCRIRRKAAACEEEGGGAVSGGGGGGGRSKRDEAVEEMVAVAVESSAMAAPPGRGDEPLVKTDLGSMEKLVKGDQNETMTLGIGSMGGSLDEYDDLMDDEAIWNEDGSFVVKPKYQAPKRQDMGPVEMIPKAGEV